MFVFCEVLLLLAAGILSCFVPLNVLLLRFVGSVCHCHRLVGGKRESVAWLSLVCNVCCPTKFVNSSALIGYVLKLWHFPDTFFSIFRYINLYNVVHNIFLTGPAEPRYVMPLQTV